MQGFDVFCLQRFPVLFCSRIAGGCCATVSITAFISNQCAVWINAGGSART
jgi:hypothetical protein